MCELTVEQLETVVEIVGNSEITYSHLPDDLIDHICCDIESEMSVGLSFNKALERVQCKFGDPGLQKIQEDTILLIDQKYRFMKTTMKIFGNVSLALIGLGTILKIFHWPGASIGLSLGFLLLGLIFYPATILASYRKNGRKNIFLHILAILGGIALMFGILFKIQHWLGASMLLSLGWIILLFIFLPLWLITYAMKSKNKKATTVYTVGVIGVINFELSTLFKIQHWPGATIMLMLGAILMVSVFLPLYVSLLYKKSEFVNGKFIYVVMIISFFVLLGTLLNLSFTRSIFKGLSYTDYYAQVEKGYFEKQNDKLFNQEISNKNLNYSPTIIHQKSDSLSNLIYSLKRKLITASNDINESVLNKYIDNIYLLNNKDKGQVNKIFFGDDDQALAKDLKLALQNYKQYLCDAVQNDPEIKTELDKLFLLDDINEYRYYKSWEYRTFKNNLMFMALIQLSDIDRNVKIAENIILSKYNCASHNEEMNSINQD